MCSNDLYQMMNEPHRGYIDLQSMHRFDYNTDLHLGYVRTSCCVFPSTISPHILSPSYRLAVIYSRSWASYSHRALDSLFPPSHPSHFPHCAQHLQAESVERRWPYSWTVSMGDARCMGMGSEEGGGCRVEGKLLQEASYDWEEGTS